MNQNKKINDFSPFNVESRNIYVEQQKNLLLHISLYFKYPDF